MKYYVDCACDEHDAWKEFNIESEAREYYTKLNCTEKILYSSDSEAKFNTMEISA